MNLKNGQNEIVFLCTSPMSFLLLTAMGAKLISPHGGHQVDKKHVILLTDPYVGVPVGRTCDSVIVRSRVWILIELPALYPWFKRIFPVHPGEFGHPILDIYCQNVSILAPNRLLDCMLPGNWDGFRLIPALFGILLNCKAFWAFRLRVVTTYDIFYDYVTQN